MLVNKKKNQKKNPRRDFENSEDNIQSMRSWVRKIEQSTNSIGSRLSAVEKRISARSNGAANNSVSGVTIIEGPIERVLSELKDGKDVKDVDYILRIVDGEIALMHDEIESQNSEIDYIRKKIEEYNTSINELKEEVKKTRDVEAKFLTDFRGRLEKIEQRAPPVMRIGKMEVPIEISGVVAGSIAIIAAGFVAFNQMSILTSPIFLAVVGQVFIGSALLKSFKAR